MNRRQLFEKLLATIGATAMLPLLSTQQCQNPEYKRIDPAWRGMYPTGSYILFPNGGGPYSTSDVYVVIGDGWLRKVLVKNHVRLIGGQT